MQEKILSSLPLAILLHFNVFYTWLWFFLNIVIFCWKSYKLPYYPSAIRWELSLVFLLPILDFCRIKLATRGNTTECVRSCLFSSCLAAPSILGYVFFLAMQTYVLHVDVWLNSISLAFVSAEMLFLLAAAVLFGRAYASYQFWL